MSPEYVEGLAERAGLDAGIALRRYAAHLRRLNRALEAQQSLVITPISPSVVVTSTINTPPELQGMQATGRGTSAPPSGCKGCDSMGEPVAEVASWTNGSYARNYKLRWLRNVPEGTKLYAAPVQPAQDVEAMTDDEIREVFMAHGFTIKDGQTDLKPYVYEAARALLARAARQSEGG